MNNSNELPYTKVVLVKYGEIALRGNNRSAFENRLCGAINKSLGGTSYSVTKEQGRILIQKKEIDDELDYDYVVKRVKLVMGIVGICPAIKTENQDIEHLRELALLYIKQIAPKGEFSFKVESKRSDKRYPIKSNEVSALIGEHIFESMENASVRMKNPDILLKLELRTDAYMYIDTIKGVGGLPYGSTGRGMLLLSGGIDSPVAGFMAAKRGVLINCAYFHSPPYTSERAFIKVQDLAKRLSDFTGGLTFYKVNFTDVQLFLYENVLHKRLTILLKRAMLIISERLAKREYCDCLITGDSLGQVASQTLAAIRAQSSAATLPIIRPLAGMDKIEIINLAEQIETYEISIRPYEDCCTIFVDKHPETQPKQDIIESIERQLWDKGLSDLIDAAVVGAERILV
ncbi:MAG: tRNA 4-thiouridine(8) synthase ThiI [Defluviitaleaceae bacterium]|nr:tRNA 4-thiouridine(8) synthase ThiI [Defluviitaleaceae bacterium]